MARSRAVVVASALAAAAVLGTSALGWWLGRLARTASPVARVVEVLDGDTVVVSSARGRDVVRLLGVDTPETVHPDRGAECYGPEASAFTARRLAGRTVRLELDVVRRDRYGRLLAYVWWRGERFNDVLVRRGFARVLHVPPNDRHARALLFAELEARAQGRGLWAAC